MSPFEPERSLNSLQEYTPERDIEYCLAQIALNTGEFGRTTTLIFVQQAVQVRKLSAADNSKFHHSKIA